jgi:uncharacterized membrane protein YkvA (DUF1232 family)
MSDQQPYDLEQELLSVNDAIDEVGVTSRLRRFTGKIPFAVQTMAMYYAMKDPRTSMVDRVIMLGAIGYVVSSVDAWPEFMGGFADDAGVVAVAVAKVSRSLLPEHFELARAFFGIDEDDDDDDEVGFGVPV